MHLGRPQNTTLLPQSLKYWGYSHGYPCTKLLITEMIMGCIRLMFILRKNHKYQRKSLDRLVKQKEFHFPDLLSLKDHIFFSNILKFFITVIYSFILCGCVKTRGPLGVSSPTPTTWVLGIKFTMLGSFTGEPPPWPSSILFNILIRLFSWVLTLSLLQEWSRQWENGEHIKTFICYAE